MTVARAHNPIKRVAPFHMTLAPWIAINQFILSHAFVNNLAMISAGARHPRPATRRTAPSTGPPLPTWDPGPSKISEGCDVMGGGGGGEPPAHPCRVLPQKHAKGICQAQIVGQSLGRVACSFVWQLPAFRRVGRSFAARAPLAGHPPDLIRADIPGAQTACSASVRGRKRCCAARRRWVRACWASSPRPGSSEQGQARPSRAGCGPCTAPSGRAARVLAPPHTTTSCS